MTTPDAGALAALVDRLAIDDLVTAYADALDHRAWDRFAQCFTADATVDYTSSGGPAGPLTEVLPWLEEMLALFSMSQHLVTNRMVQVTGDEASGRAYFFNPMRLRAHGDGAEALFYVGGYYDDRFVRTGDGWRIAARLESMAWTGGDVPKGLA